MEQQETPKRDWTTRELAELAGVDPSRIRQLLLAKQLNGYKRANTWFIPDYEARRWLASRPDD